MRSPVCALTLLALAAAPVFAASVKQQLLEWAEAQPWRMDAQADPDRIPVQKGIEFSRPTGEPSWIQVTTRVDLSCGEDTSAYLYSWSGDRWARRFTFEPEDPLNTLQIEAGRGLVLATGWPPACASAWHPFFIGLYKVDPRQKTLIEGTENANSEGVTSARLESNGMRVEFTGRSIDPLLSIRRRVLHYVIDASGIHRADPIALSAQDFVDEWIASPWSDASAWSDAPLAGVHDQLPKQGQMGVVKRCAGAQPVWQVTVVLANQARYFSVLDSGDHRYRMLAVSDTPCKPAKR